MKIWVIYEPKEYFDLLRVNVLDQYISKNEIPDLIHFFAKTVAVFKKEMQSVL